MSTTSTSCSPRNDRCDSAFPKGSFWHADGASLRGARTSARVAEQPRLPRCVDSRPRLPGRRAQSRWPSCCSDPDIVHPHARGPRRFNALSSVRRFSIARRSPLESRVHVSACSVRSRRSHLWREDSCPGTRCWRPELRSSANLLECRTPRSPGIHHGANRGAARRVDRLPLINRLHLGRASCRGAGR